MDVGRGRVQFHMETERCYQTSENQFSNMLKHPFRKKTNPASNHTIVVPNTTYDNVDLGVVLCFVILAKLFETNFDIVKRQFSVRIKFQEYKLLVYQVSLINHCQFPSSTSLYC